ncbi:serine/threonine-protein kinase [Nocardia ignorata]|uniref:non-specific serine/threonine protein kinase n=1 Tax=Nocardia ignorata TaxID=145285 RepID=A0A4R6PPS3_NOCIG|nr:serine/threonine-protein kinase [Nocardia ignorata]TDP39766.1 serine/threonine-protein kinase [Nocardia ignorata]
MTLLPGTVIGGYRIERLLGTGGMGSVYLAAHPSLPRRDALKVLSSELTRDTEFRARFQREADLAAGLDHPNIVAVHDRGEDGGYLWIAMQYVDGTDAAAELARSAQAMTPQRALRIITEVGTALDYAHRRGLLHRDVKPANFMLSTPGHEDERVLLTDFGVAKSLADTSELTAAGAILATIAYAAPEQLQGGRLDHRTDIYALGCALYKLLTGANPFPATQPALVMAGHLYEPPPRPSSLDPRLPPALDDVIAVAMAKDPAGRFNSCRELSDAAHRALTVGARPVRVRNSRRRLLSAAVAGVLVIGAGALVLRPSADAPNTTAVATSPVRMGATSAAQVRADNPQFAGKTIGIVDISAVEATAASGYSPAATAIHLARTPQAALLESFGFAYYSGFGRVGDEPSPRALDNSARWRLFGDHYAADYLLVVRSDPGSGAGSLLGLDWYITAVRALVIVIDDPKAVAALCNYGTGSDQQALDSVVPILRHHIT